VYTIIIVRSINEYKNGLLYSLIDVVHIIERIIHCHL